MGVIDLKMRALWPLANGVIPGGWSRDTDYDALYFEGDGSVAGGTGGAATHQHTWVDHDHNGFGHVHSVSADEVTASSVLHDTGGTSVSKWAKPTHSHGAGDSGEATIGYADASVSGSAEGAEPPHVEVIIIKPDDGGQLLPVDAVALWEAGADPVGYQFTDGSGGAPDYRDRFLKGAPAGADAGGTGGSADHTHTGDHDHDPDVHSHPSVDAKVASAQILLNGVAAVGLRAGLLNVHHLVGLVSKVLSDVSTDGLGVASASNLPAYVRLAAVQNQGAGASLPAGAILLFKGSAADVPGDWLLCDGTEGTVDTVDRQVYVVSVKGEVGDTGGADAHLHAGIPHGHTHVASHVHFESVSTLRNKVDELTGTVGKSTPIDPHIADANAGPSSSVEGRLPFVGLLFVRYSPATSSVMPGGYLRRRRRRRGLEPAG